MKFSIAAVTAALLSCVAAAPALEARVPPTEPFAIQVKARGLIKHHWEGRFVRLLTDYEKGVNYITVDLPNNWGGHVQAEYSLRNGFLIWEHHVLYAGFENNSEHDYRSPLVFGTWNTPGMTIETGLGFSIPKRGENAELQLNGDDNHWYVCQKDGSDLGSYAINYGRSWTGINPNCHNVKLFRVYAN